MGLRDRLRGLRGVEEGSTDYDVSSDAGDAAAVPAAAELDEFTPRQDGDYCCAERGLNLRFSRPTVTETAAGHDEPALGEFPNTGRFAVQRRFERPIVFTVLEPSATDGSELVVRRTDTETRESAAVRYRFEPDGD